MMKSNYKKAVLELSDRIGRSEARRLLVVHGASPHTADKLLRGNYPSEVGQLLGQAILAAVTASKRTA